MKGRRSLVQGVGINDADYYVVPRISGNTRLKCKYYEAWQGMLGRAYSKTIIKWNKIYEDVTVCEEWLTFSNFKAWMVTQEWEGKQLDKDLLIEGNREYGPNACVFLSNRVNSFIQDSYDSRDGFCVGVTLFRNGKYRARMRNNGIVEHLGYFETYEQGREVYDRRKLEIARELIEQETDTKIKAALEVKYFKEK